jgi:hypothetical protein
MRAIVSAATLGFMLLTASTANAEFRRIELKTLGMD